MKVSNETSDQDQMKICLYKPDDKFDWIPVGAGVYAVNKGEAVNWTPPAGEALPKYCMKAFHPAFFDRELAHGLVELNERVAIRGGGSHYSIDTV